MSEMKTAHKSDIDKIRIIAFKKQCILEHVRIRQIEYSNTDLGIRSHP